LAPVTSLTIIDGTCRVFSSFSAAVGASNNSGITHLHILGGSFNLNRTVGVGTSDFALLSELTIGSPHLDCRNMRTKICVRASSIDFDNGSLTMITGAEHMIEFGTVTFSNSPDIYTIYTRTPVHKLFTGLPVIHVQFAESLTYQISRLIVHNSDEGTPEFSRELLLDSIVYPGFSISVPSTESNTFTCASADGLRYRSFVHNDDKRFPALSEGETFCDDVGVTGEDVSCNPRTMSADPTPLETPTTKFTTDRNILHRMQSTFRRSSLFRFCAR
jgi:hypothetical protein